MQLRPYQQEAIDATYTWLQNNDGNALIVLPTATGKSLALAKILEDATKYQDSRVIVASHVADLVLQDYEEFMQLSPFANAGIYSAGLNQKNTHAKILFCSIQSVYKKAFKIQRCDLLCIDEAHTLSQKSMSMWHKFISDLLIINPQMRIIGLTATPFRMDSGSLLSGDNPIFHGISYEYGLLRAVQEGYLSEIVPKSMGTKLPVDGVAKRGGEFVPGELEKAVDLDEITKAAVKEIIEYGQDRRTWMVFCTGVKHCHHVAEEIRKYTDPKTGLPIVCEVVTGDTDAKERARIYNGMKDGSIRAACSVVVMTTGTNIPPIDLIAMLRPTGSAGLLVQMCGRGMRLFLGKLNCVLLDFAENLRRHGPLDMIRAKEKNSTGMGVPPMKDCPKCFSILFAGIRVCPHCGEKFPEPELKIKAIADNVAVFSNQRIFEDHAVSDVRYGVHNKPGKPPSLRVEYMSGDVGRICSEWVCLEHTGRAKENAAHWWLERMDGNYVPKTVEEAMKIGIQYLKKPVSIKTYEEGKFTRIQSYVFDPGDPEGLGNIEQESGPVQQSQLASHPSELDSYEIPF